MAAGPANDTLGFVPPSLEHHEALRRERRRQVRGLLLLAAAVLAFLVYRGRIFFPPGWWRL